MYSSPNIVRVTRSRGMNWTGHLASVGKQQMHTGFWCGDLREGVNLEEPSLDESIILKYIL